MHLTVVSTGRADLGGLTEILHAACGVPGWQPRLVLAGDVDFARGEVAREQLRCPVVPLVVGDSGGAAERIGALIPELLAEVRAHPPDVLLVLGDRYELLAVLAVAIAERLPLAHVSGGECTFGALDEQVRHAVTKAAHIHFVAHASFAERVRRMGEEAWRVHVTGDPGLDRIARADLASAQELGELLHLPVRRDTLLVAFHPVTNAPEETWSAWTALAEALDEAAGAVVVTSPNADPQGAELRARQEAWCAGHPRRRFVAHLGQRNFMGLLREGGCLLGNSSAAIWEAPSLGAPAINLGRRQEGRLRGANVIDLPEPTPSAIATALAHALEPTFRERLSREPNPYGDGHAAPLIVSALGRLPNRATLLEKRFAA